MTREINVFSRTTRNIILYILKKKKKKLPPARTQKSNWNFRRIKWHHGTHVCGWWFDCLHRVVVNFSACSLNVSTSAIPPPPSVTPGALPNPSAGNSNNIICTIYSHLFLIKVRDSYLKRHRVRGESPQYLRIVCIPMPRAIF